MVTYDANLIQEYADRMYRSASQTVVMYSLGGIITGASVGLVSRDPKLTVVAAILVGILGYLMGKGKAFKLKLEAQLALCQVQIEENTRGLDRRRFTS
jgi:hypothetical protein